MIFLKKILFLLISLSVLFSGYCVNQKTIPLFNGADIKNIKQIDFFMPQIKWKKSSSRQEILATYKLLKSINQKDVSLYKSDVPIHPCITETIYLQNKKSIIIELSNNTVTEEECVIHYKNRLYRVNSPKLIEILEKTNTEGLRVKYPHNILFSTKNVSIAQISNVIVEGKFIKPTELNGDDIIKLIRLLNSRKIFRFYNNAADKGSGPFLKINFNSKQFEKINLDPSNKLFAAETTTGRFVGRWASNDLRTYLYDKYKNIPTIITNSAINNN